MNRLAAQLLTRSTLLLLGCAFVGCATMKESDTARTGLEQLLVSSAADQALNRVDLTPIAHAKVYIEQKYLDCVDKNYIVVALHQRLLGLGCTLVEKSEEADVVLEISSGGVGTDRKELFVGVPQIPLPPPSPIAIPKMPLFTKNAAMGTAKLLVVAYDNKSKQQVINSGYTLARSDHRNWSVLGMSGITTGSVPNELARWTGETDSVTQLGTTMQAKRGSDSITR